MRIRATAFIGVTAVLGAAVLTVALRHWQSTDPLRFSCYLLLAVLASKMKVRLPAIDGTMSVNFLFVLLGVLELSLSETLVIGCAAGLVQCLWRPQQPLKLPKVIFNVLSMMANAVCFSYLSYHLLSARFNQSMPLLLVISASVYFLSNTLPVAYVIVLIEGKSFRKVWTQCYFWTFPYYLAGAALIGFASFCNRHFGWQSSLLIAPVIYWVYRSYHLYLGRLEDGKRQVEAHKQQVEAQKSHAEEVAALQVRTVEALALAIGAKDHTTHTHLQRVRTYALAIAQDLGLCESDVNALRAASLLHDIGKLAVPEHIISKPGRLTPEEFEKMRIHPVVGAAILEKVSFPYPVVPIVRSHHEKWNGAGYPDGLKGEQIPIGARILAAVDCLDALASDRQYRKALPLDDAMKKVSEEAGISFDPRVVEVLQRRYLELEKLALSSSSDISLEQSSIRHTVKRGDRPAAGFECASRIVKSDEDFLASIAAARHEAQTLFELGQELGSSLSLDETLSLVSVKLRKLIPYDSLAAFVLQGEILIPEFVTGDNYKLLSSLEIPVGKGLCGWVVQNCKPIINGNPAVEPGYQRDPKRFTDLRSALAVPLVGAHGSVGALALYQSEPDAFTTDHLRILQVITSKVALSLENSLKYRRAERSATTDHLTGLPNARSLFIHLDRELARCKRDNTSMAVLVCDMDGFKQINDRHGHAEGDKALKVFAASLREVCRANEFPARMGGDEFVVIAPEMSSDAASAKAILLSALAQRAGREISGKDRLSLSVGIASYPEDGQTAEQLLVEADKRMYQTKECHHAHFEGSLLPTPRSQVARLVN